MFHCIEKITFFCLYSFVCRDIGFQAFLCKIYNLQPIVYPPVTNNDNFNNLDMAMKRNFKRETESLLMAAQDSAIRTNYIKARIDKMQQNSKRRQCGDRDETINHIKSECSKLAQKEYKARYDWVGKKCEFDHANKWYMHNPAPILEDDRHKLLWDFDINTDHLISPRRPDLMTINNNNNKKKKKICKIVDFAVPADHRIKLKECEKRDKYLDLARELKKLWNIKVGTVTKGLLKGLVDLEVGGRVETLQTTELLRTARILRKVMES